MSRRSLFLMKMFVYEFKLFRRCYITYLPKEIGVVAPNKPKRPKVLSEDKVCWCLCTTTTEEENMIGYMT